MVGSRYKLPEYGDLRRKLWLKRQCGEEYMQVTAVSFWKWAAGLEWKVLTAKVKTILFGLIQLYSVSCIVSTICGI